MTTKTETPITDLHESTSKGTIDRLGGAYDLARQLEKRLRLITADRDAWLESTAEEMRKKVRATDGLNELLRIEEELKIKAAPGYYAEWHRRCGRVEMLKELIALDTITAQDIAETMPPRDAFGK